MSLKKNIKVLRDIWDETGSTLICPQCNGSLTMIQIEPIITTDSAYTSYRTVIECTSCSFKLETESFTILGSVKDFNMRFVDIGSWSPTGIRILSSYEHILDYNLLKTLKETGELVEFLIINNHIVQVI